ncbi:hypothetical protein SISNIDRAFT_456686 [Sistotremastrum niveocremeum HHB9708]|uniref:Uncharacterized protein n=2 Tax=Sistotremastraceae TaxID=3402574 RepID=A0A164SFG6_9AGAM|nr:hypothetical protein SISNIDRAFT_456686 [Sistotremastrum niveocremeum HHB9708]KZT35726.1 hypothetical protein SISSUDRAFT_1050915 [Sistotremastrum suecicum HHB10207 ss-3]
MKHLENRDIPEIWSVASAPGSWLRKIYRGDRSRRSRAKIKSEKVYYRLEGDRSLPNELMAITLLYCVRSFDEQFVGEPSEWRHLMHVCSRWSSLIRSDSRFWRRINISWHSQTISRHLSLSKDSLLDLDITVHDQSVSDLKKLLRSTIGRAGALSIRTSYTHSQYYHERDSRSWSLLPMILDSLL